MRENAAGGRVVLKHQDVSPSRMVPVDQWGRTPASRRRRAHNQTPTQRWSFPGPQTRPVLSGRLCHCLVGVLPCLGFPRAPRRRPPRGVRPGPGPRGRQLRF